MILMVAMVLGGLAFQPSKTASPTVIFVCEHGAAKSVIATAYFNKLAAERGLKARATYRGVNPQAEHKGYPGLRDAIKAHVDRPIDELLQKQREKGPAR